jgi:hypothetical protein
MINCPVTEQSLKPEITVRGFLLLSAIPIQLKEALLPHSATDLLSKEGDTIVVHHLISLSKYRVEGLPSSLICRVH